MAIYTVHAPPPKMGDITDHPEHFLFVRDGFHFFAFLFAPLWLLRYRLWLALISYIFVVSILFVSLDVVEAPEWATVLAIWLINFLVGFEASTLRRWKLVRRGWKTIGFVVGEDQELAEQRFFSKWVRRAEIASPSSSPDTTLIRRVPPSGNDVIGLFPEPELKR